MALNVKNKIWLGTLFLFLLLVLTGGLSIYYMAKIKTESKNILHDNYESLLYGHDMQTQLNSFETSRQQSNLQFEKSLQKQEGNITEPNEMEATKAVRKYFTEFTKGDTSRQNIKNLQKELQSILTLNMNAIKEKNAQAENTAEEAFAIIIALAVIVFIIAFTFTINFPSV